MPANSLSWNISWMFSVHVLFILLIIIDWLSNHSMRICHCFKNRCVAQYVIYTPRPKVPVHVIGQKMKQILKGRVL